MIRDSPDLTGAESLESMHSVTRKTATAASTPDNIIKFDDLPNSAHVDVRTVAILFSAGISTVWARAARGDLPKPKKFGRATRWNVGELRAVLREASHVAA